MPRTRRPAVLTARWVAPFVVGAVLTSGCTQAKLDENGVSSALTTTTDKVALVDPAGTGRGPITSGDSPVRGMRGAVPGFRVDDAFRDRVLELDPAVVDLPAAAQGYDSVIVIALATETARSDTPGRIAAGIVGVTEQGQSCTDFARCRALALENDNLDYDGLSGTIELLGNGDPGQAGFAIVEYDGTGRLRTLDEVTVQAPALATPPAPPDPTFGPTGDGILTIGTLLPVLGPDPEAARGALAGAQLAVSDINRRGGVLGDPMVLLPDESGDGSPTATTTATKRLLDQHVDAVLGGTAYGITSVALPPITAAGVVLLSPTDTARALSVASDHGLFFRVAPSTDLEGQVLGRLITEDGFTKVAVIRGPDDDDLDLGSDVVAALNAAAATVTATVDVEAGGDMGVAAQQALDSAPQALVLATPPDLTAELVKALVVKGKGPRTLPTYGTAANMTPEMVTAVGG